jgi:hypothetical protein
MLKNDNLSQRVKKLQRSVNELNLDLEAIREEHDRYVLGASKDEAMDWFNSLPIETLCESLNREHKNPRTKFNLQDMKHKFALRRLHEQKKSKLEDEKIKLNVARIDCIIAKIQDIENGIYESSSVKTIKKKG